jgi:AcrR family transcriptional regulator
MHVSPEPKEGGLERDRVVCAALELINERGYAGLTLRRLADKLHVKAAALYWYFENKQDLIDAMAEHIIQDEFRRVQPKNVQWRDLLTTIAHTHRTALRRYRDGAQIMAHANMRQTSMLDGLEFTLKTLEAQGFDAKLAMGSTFTIIRFTLGCVFEEQADPRNDDLDKKEMHAQHLRAMKDKYPTIARSIYETAAGADGKLREDAMFECGLELVLDGVEKHLITPKR